MKDRINFTFKAAGWFCLTVVPPAVFLYAAPQMRSVLFFKFTAAFLLWSVFLLLSFFGVGNFLRARVLNSAFGLADIALGFGLIALFLSFYLKVSLHPTVPLIILGLGAVWGLVQCWQNFSRIIMVLKTNEFPWLALVGAFCGVYLLFGRAPKGFIYLPSDFDSALVHLTLPAAIVAEGKFFLPDWVRAPWHPLLTHFWYIFTLQTHGILYAKALNVAAFVQIGWIFIAGRTPASRALGALFLAFLLGAPEFSDNITSTSLDAVMALFMVCAFAVFSSFLSDPSRSTFVLLVFLCAFAGGQKHFGLMFSAPLLCLAGLEYLRRQALTERRFDWRRLVRPTAESAALALMFIVLVVPFYLHNVTHGGSPLLFPFFGGRENAYGWSNADIDLMLTSVIPQWGYTKSFFGFFLLPYHLLKYPEKYQYMLVNEPYDLMLSVVIACSYLLLLLALLVRPLRRVEALLPIAVLILQIVFWYRGSQVVRYLFPVLITAFVLFRQTAELLRYPDVLARRANIFAGLFIILSYAHLGLLIKPASLPVPVTREEQLDWLRQFSTPTISSLQYLEGNIKSEQTVINLATPIGAPYFSSLVLCGDWFAACRFSLFTDIALKFKEWPELLPEVRKKNAAYIRVSWDMFDPKAQRPSPADNWSGHFPESTAKCLEHVFTDNIRTDVFKIKDECK